MLDTNGFTQSPERVLRRQWKQYKPHLPKSISLPALQLKPFNRPQFNCHRCGYTNFLIPLCLWCAWSSPEATRAWEASLPRCRTISAPAKVFWKANSDNLEQRRPRTSLESVASTLPPITPRGPSLDIPICDPSARTESGNTHSHVVNDNMKLSEPGEPGYSDLDDSQAISTTKPPLSLDDSRSRSTSTKSSRPTPSFFQIFDPRNTSDNMDIDSEYAPHSQSLSTVFDVPITPRRHPPPSPSRLTSQPHTLRRKKRMTILRQQSSCSLRSRFRAYEMPNRPRTPPSVRLGTPSRPYYTAIRKNMSRPGSPSPARSPSPCPSQLVPPSHILPRLMSIYSDSEEDVPIPPLLSRTLNPYPRHSGFSLSGEVELHIALSRKRSAEYRFRETGREKAKGACASGSVRGKVKKLGKGIKEIVFGRTWRQAG